MSRIKRNHKVVFYIALIAGVLVYTFFYGIGKDMDHTISEALERHTGSMAIAISELKYGLRGYYGYDKVRLVLENNGMTGKPAVISKYGKSRDHVLRDRDILNNAIKKAVNIEDPASLGLCYLFRHDKGLVTYYKWAFRIFGYKIEAFYYFYFLLLIISVFIFLATFYNRLDLLNVLLLFLCSHFVVVAAAPAVGINLETVHNVRFLPVLAVLPAVYIALVILGKHRFTARMLIYTLIETLVFILVIHTRTSSKYQIIFLTMVFILGALWVWIKRPRLGRYVFNKVHFWPLAIVFLAFFMLRMHLAYELNYPYLNTARGHVFWHVVYLGLGAHPDAMNKYGIDYASDKLCDDVAERRTMGRYRAGGRVDYALSENAIKEEFFDIAGKDPRFVLESYFYKFLLFFKNYFGPAFGATPFLLKWNILLVILGGSFLGCEVFTRQWFYYFSLFFLGLVFSLGTAIFAMPEPHLIPDPALLFTLLIYMVFSGIGCLVMKRLL